MKQIKVLVKKDNGWELLHEGPQAVKVEFDPEDREKTQLEGYVFDPNAPEPELREKAA